MKPAPAYITGYNIVTPLGFDVESNFNALLKGESGIKSHPFFGRRETFYASVINHALLNERFEARFGKEDFTRLEKMLLLALKPLMEEQKVSQDTLLILSTTKGNITALKNQKTPPESAYLSQLAQKIADFYGFRTKPIVVSNACVSGVLAVSVAKNLLKAGLAKDAFVIAGDEVSEFVISGFNSFQAMSSEPCKPYDANRTGISLGEAAAAVYMTTELSGKENFKFEIAGDAAVNDANHISGPSRTGEGLFKSVKKALEEAELNPEDLSFISAHGTATPYNDEMEAIAFSRMNLQRVPLNSMKGYYGHCLGASGLLETAISMECALRGMLLPSKNFETSGVSEAINIIRENTPAEISTILKTASGFGGCNAALVLKFST
ncbi:MAG: beta-ketoacyl synthase [Kaistella sp.]|nr:beta-ketoacyl synthase [Kaistella sp.]